MSRAPLSSCQKPNSSRAGFTLVEMLVIAPLAVLTIAVLVSSMVTMVGDSLITLTRASDTYMMQNALDRIEQDTRITSAFLSSFTLMPPGQGRLADDAHKTDTTAFATSTSDLILNQAATTRSPYESTRSIVYYANQPFACTDAAVTQNRALALKTVYFTRDDGKNQGTKNLWRRVIVPPWNLNTGTAIDGNSVCNQPWQRDNCPGLYSSDCQAIDEKLLENVSSFTQTYYDSSGNTVTNSRLASSLKVSLTVTEKVAGQTITATGGTRVTRLNENVDEIPAAVQDIAIKNPTINTDNNPTKATFGWSATPFASVYSVWYQINGGTKVTKVVSVPEIAVPARPLDNIKIGVTALNDMGASPEATYNGTTGYNMPLWTKANLINGWVCYNDTEATYPCPRYTLTKGNMVVVSGLAKGGTDWSTMFVLPAGVRPKPSKTLIFNSVSSSDFGRLNINPTGEVVWIATAEASSATYYVSLDSVRFNPATTGWAYPTLNTANGWVNYGWQYENLEYLKDSYGRVYVNGLVCKGTTVATGAAIATLPANYQASNSYQMILEGFSADRPSHYRIYPSTTAPTITTGGTGGASSTDCNASFHNISAIYHSVTSAASAVSIPLTSPWVTDSTSYSAAFAQKAPDGVVSIKGLIKDGSSLTTQYTTVQTLGTLPSGYRPSKNLLFLVAGTYYNGTSATYIPVRVDVTLAGQITLVPLSAFPATGYWLSLDNIHFYADGG